MSTSPTAWYAIHTRGNHENKVETYLHKKGLEVFLPRMTTLSRRKDRKRTIEVPLFPGYIFAHVKLSYKTYFEIIKSPGVVRILGDKGKFSPIPPETMASIRTMASSRKFCYPWSNLTKGQLVRIVDGPLSGVIGVIERTNEKKRRLVVTVELLSRSVAVDLENEVVELYS